MTYERIAKRRRFLAGLAGLSLAGFPPLRRSSAAAQELLVGWGTVS